MWLFALVAWLALAWLDSATDEFAEKEAVE
jgi:hypothetical protein